MNILEVKDLSHDFKGLKVLTDITFEVEKGVRHAIIGPNGAGKTTLFNIITGTYKPRSGHVYFKGMDITRAEPYKIQRLGMGRSFQITSTFDRLTVFENVRLPVLSRKGIRFNVFRDVDKLDEVTKEVDEILKKVNLHTDRNTPAKMLSYGKNRSLEITMALAGNPDLIMLDEPTSGMSVDETHYAVSLIKQLTEGKTAVIIEHDMDVVFSFADRITVLHHGVILATGNPRDIRANPEVQAAYLGALEMET